jgi:hypothetical protein
MPRLYARRKKVRKIESVLIFAIPLTPVLKGDVGVAPVLGKG